MTPILLQTVNSLLAQIRKERGCLHCDFHDFKDKKNDFSLIEEWKTQEDLDAHMDSKVFGVLSGAMRIMGHSWKITLRTSSGTKVIENSKRIRT